MSTTTDARKVKLEKGDTLTLAVGMVERWTGQYGENVTIIGLTADGEAVSTLVKADIADKQTARNFKLDRAELLAGRGVLIAKTPEGYTNITPFNGPPAMDARKAKTGIDSGPLIPGMDDDAPYADGAPSALPSPAAAPATAAKLAALYAAYRECAQIAAQTLSEATGREDIDPAAVNAGAATLMIARKDRGLL